jgi:hypothetical protein
MTDDDTPRPAESDASLELTRRRFLQGSGAAAAGVFSLLQDSQALANKTGSPHQPSGWAKRNRPNFLILMCDEMRYPPIYESQATKAFRQQYLQTQNSLRENGIDFQRHYAASVACSPSRGLNQDNWTGITYNSVIQPNHIETVIARLDNGGGPKVWKYSRYFDNPQFWSTPGTPGDPNVDVEDAILEQKEPTPSTDGTSPIACQITVKHTPKPDEFEMYNVSDDPMELNNLYNAQSPSPEQITLAQLLEQQCAQKRLRPISGQVPGQPTCAP